MTGSVCGSGLGTCGGRDDGPRPTGVPRPVFDLGCLLNRGRTLTSIRAALARNPPVRVAGRVRGLGVLARATDSGPVLDNAFGDFDEFDVLVLGEPPHVGERFGGVDVEGTHQDALGLSNEGA